MMIVKSGDGIFFLSCATCAANSESVKRAALRVALALAAGGCDVAGRPTQIVKAKKNVRMTAIFSFPFIAMAEILDASKEALVPRQLDQPPLFDETGNWI